MAASKAAAPRDRAVRSITDAMIASDQCVSHSEGSLEPLAGSTTCSVATVSSPLAEGAETADPRVAKQNANLWQRQRLAT